MKTKQHLVLKPGFLPLIIIVILIAVVGPGNVFAAVGISNARAVGLAGAYLSVAQSSEAPDWNPANLGLYMQHDFSMNFLSIGIGIHNNSFSKKQYDQHNGKFIDPADKEKLLNCIPDDGMAIYLDSEVQLLGFAYRNFAFTASGQVVSDLTISKDIFELGFLGNADANKPVFDFGDTDGTAIAVYNYAISAAFPIELRQVKKFAVGGNLKFLQGLYCYDVVKAGGALSTDTKIYGKGETVVQYAEGGTGFALDLGAASIINKRWSVGLTLNNISNFVSWNKNAKREAIIASTDSLDFQDVVDADDVDSLFHDENNKQDINSFSTSMPAEMRIGAVYRAATYFVTMDYIQGFKKELNVTTIPKLACGIEYKPLFWLPLRAGMAIGGREFFTIAIGIGFEMGRVRLDLAATNQGSILPGSRQGSTLAFGVRLMP